MTSKRPGAPRSARRPVAASGGRRPAARPAARGTSSRSSGPSSRGSSSRSGASSRGPAAAARPRSAGARQPGSDGPGITLTRRTLVLVSLVVVALAALVPTVNSYVAQRQQLAALREEVAQQEADVEALQEQVDRWEDPAFVAAQARERLLFAMPGETQYRLTDTSGQEVPLTEEQQAAEAAAEGEWFATLWSSVEASSQLTAEDIPDETGVDSPEDEGEEDPVEEITTDAPETDEDTAE